MSGDPLVNALKENISLGSLTRRVGRFNDAWYERMAGELRAALASETTDAGLAQAAREVLGAFVVSPGITTGRQAKALEALRLALEAEWYQASQDPALVAHVEASSGPVVQWLRGDRALRDETTEREPVPLAYPAGHDDCIATIDHLHLWPYRVGTWGPHPDERRAAARPHGLTPHDPRCEVVRHDPTTSSCVFYERPQETTP